MDITQRPKRGRRGPPGPPGPAGSGGGAIATVSDSASIDMVLAGDDLSANANTGTTAGTVAAGNHGHSHTALTNIGGNTHAQIDTHIADLSNPHAVTKAQVGLGSVDNTSDAAKPVSTAQATAIALKQDADPDLTAIASLPATTDNVIQSVASAWASRTPAQLKSTLALVKGDVGLGAVDNVQQVPITLFDAKGDLLVGTGPDTAARLAVGADGTFPKADSTQTTGILWTTIPGGGDVVGPAASVDSEAALFSGTTGKLLKRATGSGLVKRTAGVDSIAVAGTDYQAAGSYQAADADLTDLAAIARAQGDLIVGGASAWVRLAKGAAMQRLRMNIGATDPEWADDLDMVGRFRLGADGAAIGAAIANFFGATSAFVTAAATIYYVIADCYFTKTTAGTVVWTITSSVSMTAAAIGNTTPGVLTGNAATVAAVTAAATPASGSLTTGVKHYMQIVAVVETNTAGNIRLNVTSSGGTVTPLRSSMYRVYRMPSANTGSFVA